ncbi:hypothetical protein [Thioalkalivibrio sp.]|uniref:hypothetical protein n=1 Tax=Thioalkalivibrio sp. TaxID=2093813 RepID=UPI003565406F
MTNCPGLPIDWADALLVVAHPDDEILWFSSCVECVAKVVVCFHEVRSQPLWTEGREESIKQFPLSHAVFLRLTQAEVFEAAKWPSPEAVEFGVKVSNSRGRSQPFSEQLYRDNFTSLRELLRPQVEGCKVVLTHNPWGEYGHEEHIQVFRAVLSLQEEMGFEVWCDNYLTAKSQDLFSQWVPRLDPDFVRAPTNRAIAETMKELYSTHGCWTWFPDYQWPVDEAFFRVTKRDLSPAGSSKPNQVSRYGSVFPLNYIMLKWSRPRRGIRGALRRLRPRFRRLVRRFFR